MPNINRVRVDWSNFPGAPGLSTFYLDAATTNVTALKTFFTAIKDLFPNGLTTNVPQTGDVIDSATGKIVGAWTGTGGGTSTSTATANPFAGAAGGLVRWQTNGVLNGRRLRGRTFLVPLERTQFDNNGSLSTTCISTISAAATAMIATYTPALLIWGPPRNAGTLGPTDPGKAALVSPVVSAVVPDLCVVQRSRRI